MITEKPKKIIFLDMDGVMNSTQSSHRDWIKHGRQTFTLGFEDICPIAASNLNWLLEKSDAKIVISSTWRLHFPIEDWNEKMAAICPAIVGRVIDRTPLLHGQQRGEEIYKWLQDNECLCVPFVVLDDTPDMDKVHDRFVQTNPDHGFMFADLQKAAALLGVIL